ncbi:MAG: hypothetical protein ACLGIN_04450, partial [Candidatus Sericytochromatia bacterium]
MSPHECSPNRRLRRAATRVLPMALGLAMAFTGLAWVSPPPVAAEFVVAQARPASQLLGLVGKNMSQAEALLGRPEKATDFQTIYNLPGQEQLQWLFYQRHGVLLGADRNGTVEALLFLPNYGAILGGGIRLGMTQAQVTAALGAPDHQIVNDDSVRYVYGKWAYDLTFEPASGKLEQVLYYPALRRLTAVAAPTPPPTQQPTPPATPRGTP